MRSNNDFWHLTILLTVVIQSLVVVMAGEKANQILRVLKESPKKSKRSWLIV